MAGTSAGFDKASPVERDGLEWTVEELHLDKLPTRHTQKSAMPTVLALEGLEYYDMPQNGDVRRVESLNTEFVYFDKIRGWIQKLKNSA